MPGFLQVLTEKLNRIHKKLFLEDDLDILALDDDEDEGGDQEDRGFVPDLDIIGGPSETDEEKEYVEIDGELVPVEKAEELRFSPLSGSKKVTVEVTGDPIAVDRHDPTTCPACQEYGPQPGIEKRTATRKTISGNYSNWVIKGSGVRGEPTGRQHQRPCVKPGRPQTAVPPEMADDRNIEALSRTWRPTELGAEPWYKAHGYRNWTVEEVVKASEAAMKGVIRRMRPEWPIMNEIGDDDIESAAIAGVMSALEKDCGVAPFGNSRFLGNHIRSKLKTLCRKEIAERKKAKTKAFAPQSDEASITGIPESLAKDYRDMIELASDEDTDPKSRLTEIEKYALLVGWGLENPITPVEKVAGVIKFDDLGEEIKEKFGLESFDRNKVRRTLGKAIWKINKVGEIIDPVALDALIGRGTARKDVRDETGKVIKSRGGARVDFKKIANEYYPTFMRRPYKELQAELRELKKAEKEEAKKRRSEVFVSKKEEDFYWIYKNKINEILQEEPELLKNWRDLAAILRSQFGVKGQKSSGDIARFAIQRYGADRKLNKELEDLDIIDGPDPEGEDDWNEWDQDEDDVWEAIEWTENEIQEMKIKLQNVILEYKNRKSPIYLIAESID